MAKIYLDYNATCPLFPETIEAMVTALGEVGNASSVHGFGRAARKRVEDARAAIAALVEVRPAQVIFNGGATEGNNTILSGYDPNRVWVGASEHPSVLRYSDAFKTLPVQENGVIDLSVLEKMLQEGEKPELIAVQLVNSETGVIQPVAEIARLAHDHGARILCDAVQGAGRIPLDFAVLGVDYMTLCAHKFGGPQGVGALIFREGLQLPKLLRGGGQERRQRAGTENVAGIAGFGAAATRAKAELESYRSRTAALQQKLETGLKALSNDIRIAGETAPRVTNTTTIILPGIPAETQLMALDLEGVAVSSGSACSSGSFKASHVLTSMGYDEDTAKSSLRLSLGWATTEAEIDAVLMIFINLINRLYKKKD